MKRRLATAVCCYCKQQKDIESFHIDRTRPTKRYPACKDCQKVRTAMSRRKLRNEVLFRYSNGTMSCACCGEDHREFLSIEHDSGGGVQHRKSIGGAAYLHGWLKKNNWPNGYSVLCYNCNCSKGFFGYCPHTTEQMNKQGDDFVASNKKYRRLVKER